MFFFNWTPPSRDLWVEQPKKNKNNLLASLVPNLKTLTVLSPAGFLRSLKSKSQILITIYSKNRLRKRSISPSLTFLVKRKDLTLQVIPHLQKRDSIVRIIKSVKLLKQKVWNNNSKEETNLIRKLVYMTNYGNNLI